MIQKRKENDLKNWHFQNGDSRFLIHYFCFGNVLFTVLDIYIYSLFHYASIVTTEDNNKNTNVWLKKWTEKGPIPSLKKTVSIFSIIIRKILCLKVNTYSEFIRRKIIIFTVTPRTLFYAQTHYFSTWKVCNITSHNLQIDISIS